MPRFHFPLERLLRLRAHRAQIARRGLASALGELGRQEQRLAQLAQAVSHVEAEAAVAPNLVGLAGAIGAGLQRERRRTQQAHDLAAQVAERARDEFARLRAEHEALARLRAGRHLAWQASEAGAAQHELEELARLRRGGLVADGARS